MSTSHDPTRPAKPAVHRQRRRKAERAPKRAAPRSPKTLPSPRPQAATHAVLREPLPPLPPPPSALLNEAAGPRPQPAHGEPRPPIDWRGWTAVRERQAREYRELVREYKAMIGKPTPGEVSLPALLMHGLGVANDDPITDLLGAVQCDLETLANLVSRADERDPFHTKLLLLSRQVEVALQLYWREGSLRLAAGGAP
jgi:hypothetical protein